MSDTPATGEGGDKHKAPSELLLQQKIILLQRQHQLQSVSNSLSFPKPVRRVVFWTRPKQRQRWGDDDVLPHINWGDLFFDLFYVAGEWTHMLLACSFLAFYSRQLQRRITFRMCCTTALRRRASSTSLEHLVPYCWSGFKEHLLMQDFCGATTPSTEASS